MYLNLPALTEPLQEYIDSTSHVGGWSANCVQVTRAWMNQGLKERSITRDLKWGTPVPLEEYEDKVGRSAQPVIEGRQELLDYLLLVWYLMDACEDRIGSTHLHTSIDPNPFLHVYVCSGVLRLV